jgi:glycine oxidase
MSRTPDVIVIGGGVIGLSVAYFLARERLRVTVLDRGLVGREASWAAAGYLSFQGSSNRPGPRLELTRTSARMYEEWVDDLRAHTDVDPEYLRSGLLEICLDEAEAAEARERASWQRAAGYQAEWLDAGATRRRQPWLAPALPVHGGLLLPEVAQVRPPRLLRALAAAVHRLGVEVREHCPVGGLTSDGGRVTGVRLESGERLAAPAVVNAAGAWATQIAPEMAIMPVKPVKGTIVLLDSATRPSREIVISSRGSIYPRADRHVLVGATVEDAGYDRAVSLEALATLVGQATQMMPRLRGASFVTAWTGLRPFSHDNLPYLGPVPGLSGAHVAAGHYRSGILLAPITGLLLRQMILKQPASLAVEPYLLARLAAPPEPGTEHPASARGALPA